MPTSNSDHPEQKPEPKFSQEQYDMLLRCSDVKDMTKWNEWREEHELQEIHLEGADLNNAHLEGADLSFAHLEGAGLNDAHLEGGNLIFAHLEGAYLLDTHLKGVVFRGAGVDERTVMFGCSVDRNTDFRGVRLELAQINVGTKVLLEYNRRRMNWEDWYKKGKWWHARSLWRNTVVRGFWWLSDYGRSPWHLILCFVGLSLLFAGLYCIIPQCLVVDDEVPEIRGFIHALYFSVVTMTTLGFGDIHADPDSRIGQVLLMFQVLFGYILLGALVAYLGIFLTRDGPAGKFAPTWKPKKPANDK